MNPMIIIGCGGSGGKTVVGLRRVLEMRLRQLGWKQGIPDAWQLIWVDTLETPDEKALAFGSEIPSDDYVCITTNTTNYSDVHNAVLQGAQGRPDKARHFRGWVPDPRGIRMDLKKGAGQWRGVGRVAQVDRMGDVAKRLERAMTTISGSLPDLKLLDQHVNGGVGQANSTPFVVVISSLAGGTGAGIFLDICDIARMITKDVANNIISILFTPEIFKGQGAPKGLEFNSLAAISELTNGYLKPESTTGLDLYGDLVKVVAGTKRSSGPNFPFIIGLKDLRGVELDTPDDAYRCVTETLSSLLLDQKVGGDLVNNIAGNWKAEQQAHGTIWNHHNFGTEPDEITLNGVVSSFGSARLSLGLELFGEYVAHALAREAVEFLADTKTGASGYITRARSEMNDPQATKKEVLDFYVGRYASQFMESVGFAENIKSFMSDVDARDVLREHASKEVVREEWRDEMPFGGVIDLLRETVQGAPNDRLKSSLEKVASDRKALFMTEAPARVLQGVNEVVVSYGVPVAMAFVDELRERIVALVARFSNEQRDTLTFKDDDFLSDLIRGFKSRDRISNQNSKFEEIYKAVCAPFMWGQWAQIFRDDIIPTYGEFVEKFLLPLRRQLEQIQNEAGSVENVVDGWPKADSVPKRFRPSPLEFCMISSDRWPSKFKELLEATASKHADQSESKEDYARRAIGAGGIALEQSWNASSAARFRSSMTAEDFLIRARLWLDTPGDPFGDYLSQSLQTYLADRDSSGFAIPDADARRQEFRKAFEQAIKRALPLAQIDTAVFHKIHPKVPPTDGVKASAGDVPLKLLAEAIPFAESDDENSPYQIAYRILADSPGVVTASLRDYFDPRRERAEGILFVYRLGGAVHPASVASLSAPIAQAWRSCANDVEVENEPWTYRRTRQLSDFVGTRPSSIQSMAVGWILGRRLGLINISETKGITIDKIDVHQINDVKVKGLYQDGKLPWPLLNGARVATLVGEDKRKAALYLGAVLESLSLAQMLYATDPDALDGYEMLWNLGESHRKILQLAATGYAFSKALPSAPTPSERLALLHNEWTKKEKKYQKQIDDFESFIGDPEEFAAYHGEEVPRPSEQYEAELAEILAPAYRRLALSTFHLSTVLGNASSGGDIDDDDE